MIDSEEGEEGMPFRVFSIETNYSSTVYDVHPFVEAVWSYENRRYVPIPKFREVCELIKP